MSLTRARFIQYIGILIVLLLLGAGYWYFSVRAGVKTNTSGSQPQGTGDLSAGLVGYWAMDENTGTSAGDSSTNANAGTLTNGPTWTTGQIGSAVTFDGTDDYITIPNSTQTAGSRPMTVAAWIKRDAISESDFIFLKRGGTNDGWSFIMGSDNTLWMTVYASVTRSSVRTITDTNWHHVAATVDSSGNLMFYIDGSAAGSTGNFPSSPTTTSVALRMGASASSNGTIDGYSDHSVDEARIYNRALSPDEMAQLYRLNSPTSVDTSLKGYWSFDGDDISGTTVIDRSGARNNGTLTNGPTKVLGKVGQALDFDGTNDYVESSDSASLDITGNITLSVWAKFDDLATPDLYAPAKYETTGDQRSYRLYTDSNTGLLYFSLSSNGTSGGVTSLTYSISNLNTTDWFHIVGTYDSTTMRLYVNGVLVNQAAYAGGIYASTAPLRIGRSENTSSQYHKGLLDEVRVYNRALTASEIQSLYAVGQSDKTNTSVSQPQGTGRLDSGLAGYWKLDEGSGTSAADSSTNANTGTLTNGPTWTTGQIGSAVDFDGTDDTINVGKPAALQSLNDFSMSAWIYRKAGATVDYIASQYNGGAVGAGDFLWYIDGDDTIVINIDGTTTAVRSSAITEDVWHHVVLVMDANDRLDFYIDGVHNVSDTAVSTSAPYLHATIADLKFGSMHGGTNAFYGMIDEFRIYSRTLSADEVSQLYRLTTPTGTDTSLKGYWSFNGQDMSGTTAFDRSGSGNNGTLTNGPTKVLGKVGQALDFDGTDDTVQIPTTGFSNTVGSVLLWTRLETADAGTLVNYLFCHNSTTGGDCGSGSRIYMRYQDGYLVIGLGATSNIVTDISFPLSEWIHFSMIYDSGNWIVYKNGVRAASGVYTNTLTLQATANIGSSRNNGANGIDGQIDEVRVYNRALSASEIASLYALGQSDKTNTSVSQPQGTGRLDSGLAGYWKLDENTGTNAGDSSTNGNTGTMTSVTWIAGKIGRAGDFDGVGDYITVPDVNTLDVVDGDNFTLTGWFSRDTTGAADTIIAKRNGTASGDVGYILYLDSATSKLIFEVSDGTDEYSLTSTQTFTASGWNHCVVVWNDSNSEQTQLYVNGRVEATTVTGTFSNVNNLSNSVALVFGAESDLGADINGQLDEIRIYNRALSADEVAQLYRLTSPTGVDTGLKGYWPFNGQDMSGTTAYDRSGSGNNGTLTNGPAKAIGKIGQGLNFFPNGSDANTYVTMGDPASGVLDFGSGDFSVGFWMKGSGYVNQTSSVNVALSKKNYVLNTNAGYGFSYASTNLITFIVGNGSTSWSLTQPVSTTADGQWHFYSGVRSGGTLYLYVDGVVVASDATVTGSISNNESLYIGTTNQTPDDRNVKAVIDEVRVYNRALSAAEIKGLYDAGR